MDEGTLLGILKPMDGNPPLFAALIWLDGFELVLFVGGVQVRVPRLLKRLAVGSVAGARRCCLWPRTCVM